MRDLRIQHSSPPGDDGSQSISPDRVTPQEGVTQAAAPLSGTAPRMVLYLVFLSVLASGLAFWITRGGLQTRDLWLITVLSLLGALAERGSLRLTHNLEASVSSVPILLAAVALSPLSAMIVAAAAMLGDFRRPFMKWAIYTAGRPIAAGVAAVAAERAEAISESNLGSIVLGTIVAAATYELLAAMLAALTVRVRRSGSAYALLRTGLPVLPTAAMVYATLVAPLAIVYAELSPWAVILFLFPALAAQRLFSMYQAQRRLAQDLAVANQSLERANLSFASALVTTLDARDRYSAGHSASVAVYARGIAARLGLPEETQRVAHLAGLLHDIGKIGVPPRVLEKNGPLTLRERRQMEEHSIIGERILAKVEAYSEIARIVRHHHERYDGEGYPDGLKESEIPILARVICVADAYDAMTSARPYRDALPPAIARARLRQASGSQFDPKVVQALDRILDELGESVSERTRTDFEIELRLHDLETSVRISAA